MKTKINKTKLKNNKTNETAISKFKRKQEEYAKQKAIKEIDLYLKNEKNPKKREKLINLKNKIRKAKTLIDWKSIGHLWISGGLSTGGLLGLLLLLTSPPIALGVLATVTTGFAMTHPQLYKTEAPIYVKEEYTPSREYRSEQYEKKEQVSDKPSGI